MFQNFCVDPEIISDVVRIELRVSIIHPPLATAASLIVLHTNAPTIILLLPRLLRMI